MTPPAGPQVTAAQLAAWVAALDAVLDELSDDLVRRAVVHLTTLRDALLEAGREGQVSPAGGSPGPAGSGPPRPG